MQFSTNSLLVSSTMPDLYLLENVVGRNSIFHILDENRRKCSRVTKVHLADSDHGPPGLCKTTKKKTSISRFKPTFAGLSFFRPKYWFFKNLAKVQMAAKGLILFTHYQLLFQKLTYGLLYDFHEYQEYIIISGYTSIYFYIRRAEFWARPVLRNTVTSSDLRSWPIRMLFQSL